MSWAKALFVEVTMVKVVVPWASLCLCSEPSTSSALWNVSVLFEKLQPPLLPNQPNSGILVGYALPFVVGNLIKVLSLETRVRLVCDYLL